MDAKPTLLYLDDEKENLIGFKASFKKEYSIYTAETTKEAIDILYNNKIHVMLVDFRLNQDDGMSFIRQIKDEFTNIAFIIITAYAETEQVIDAINMHRIYGFMQKPWEYSSLKLLIRNAVEAQKIKEENESLLEEIKESKKTNHIRYNFFANMSHEIRTPLTGIIGLLDILIDTELNKVQKDYIKAIKNSSDNLLHILEDILLISKLKSNKLKLIPDICNIENLIRDIEQLFQSAINSKNLSFKTSIDEQFPKNIFIDENRLKQILSNLISNAIKFTDSGHIHLIFKLLEITSSTKKIRIEVEDTGIGIEKEEKVHIFDSFTQINSTYARNASGTGLGLAIVKNLIQQMNGEIGVISEPRKGSTFFFELELPKVDDSVTVKKDSLAEISNSLNLNILVAEDIPTNQKVIQLMLESFGCEVTLVQNGEEAVELASEKNYDLVLMDIQMPVMDGVTATKQIKSICPQLPIFGLSANSMEGDAERYISEGMDDYLTKPINKNHLFQKLNKWQSGAFK